MSGEDNSYTLKREYYGQPVNLKGKEIPQSNHIMFKPDGRAIENYGPKNPKSFTITNMVEKSSHMVNTEKIPTKSISITHIEGGWPADVINNAETEKVQREMKNWVRAKEKTENFEKKIRELIANTERVIHQNQLMDVYEEYFEENQKETIEDNFSAKIKMVFKDPEPYKRSVSKVSWIVPEEKEEQKKIAVAYRLLKTQDVDIPPNYYSPCLVWDIEKPNAPINVLSHLSEITAVSFNTKHPHILGVGCLNGTAGAFDLRENKAIGFTKIEDSHTEPVSDFVWLKSKNSNEFVTCSTDGSVIWWEIKEKEALINLVGIVLPVTIGRDKPLYLVHKDKEEEQEKEYGATKIDNSVDAGAAKFLLGTEQGTIFVANKKKNEGELGQKLGLQAGRHLGPIVGMQRNPTNFKFILTVGDWTARIWTEDLKTPIYISKYHPAYLTDCLWTPRVGMYIVSRSDGWLSGYDICYKLNESTFSTKVADSALTSMSLSAKGDKLLVGDEDGKVSLIKLSKSFYSCNDKAELDLKKNILNKLFEREQTREKALTLAKKQQVQKEQIISTKAEENIRKKIQEIETEYMECTKEFANPQQGSEDMEEESVPNPDVDVNKSQEPQLQIRAVLAQEEPVAVQNEEPKKEEENIPEPEVKKEESKPQSAKPKEESVKPKEESKPQSAKPKEESKPESAKPKEESKPESAKPKEESKPESAKPKEESKPESAKPKEESKPESAKPKEESKPESPKPKEESKPESPKPIEGEGPSDEIQLVAEQQEKQATDPNAEPSNQ